MGIKEEMAQDRCAWRNITGGPTRASADAWNTVCVLGSRTLNEYDDDDDDAAQWIYYNLYSLYIEQGDKCTRFTISHVKYNNKLNQSLEQKQNA